MIAVTGASGYVGGRVARLLAERGAVQRLVVRDPARAPRLPGAELRAASRYGAGEEMRAALAGVDTLFLVPAAESPDRVEQHKAAVDAAVAAGVRRIVYLSFLNAAPDATFTLVRQHWATEEHIRAAGVAFTFPRMSLYLDFLPLMAGADGVIAGPAGEGRVAAVTRADVADVAAAILTGGGHDGRTYDVTGAEALTMAELAGHSPSSPAGRSPTRTRRWRRRARAAPPTARRSGRSRPGSAPTRRLRRASSRPSATPSRGSPGTSRSGSRTSSARIRSRLSAARRTGCASPLRGAPGERRSA